MCLTRNTLNRIVSYDHRDHENLSNTVELEVVYHSMKSHDVNPTPSDVKQYLKINRLNKYYEHIPYFVNKFNSPFSEALCTYWENTWGSGKRVHTILVLYNIWWARMPHDKYYCVNPHIFANGLWAFSHGCSGGASDGAFNYVHDKNQVMFNYYYSPNGQCGDVYNPNDKILKSSDSAQHIFSGDEQTIMNRVQQQPIVAYFSVWDDFWLYAGGIYRPLNPYCTGYVNHAMLVYGYNYDGGFGNSYWMLQNSWSNRWGDNGKIKIAFTGDNRGTCMMYTFMTYPSMSFDIVPANIKPHKPPPPSPSPLPPCKCSCCNG